ARSGLCGCHVLLRNPSAATSAATPPAVVRAHAGPSPDRTTTADASTTRASATLCWTDVPTAATVRPVATNVSDIPASMQAVVCHGPEDYRMEEIPVPTPGPGEALLRVE